MLASVFAWADNASPKSRGHCLPFALGYSSVRYKLTTVISLLSTWVSICSLWHLPYFGSVEVVLDAPSTHPRLSAATGTRCISKCLPPLVAVGQSFPNSPLMLLINPLICNTRNLPRSWTPPYRGLWERERDPASPPHLQILSESPMLGSPKPSLCRLYSADFNFLPLWQYPSPGPWRCVVRRWCVHWTPGLGWYPQPCALTLSCFLNPFSCSVDALPLVRCKWLVSWSSLTLPDLTSTKALKDWSLPPHNPLHQQVTRCPHAMSAKKFYLSLRKKAKAPLESLMKSPFFDFFFW